jgi:hypothetical protein
MQLFSIWQIIFVNGYARRAFCFTQAGEQNSRPPASRALPFVINIPQVSQRIIAAG